ncbi:MAG TPA: hypothetical protein VJH95_03110 [Candidatus Nanoarchaeia archaeon]|nr:hypothetical protein [Candidatus Nanoarchaeia archaeon]
MQWIKPKKVHSSKKAQAAMEFLMTYGWAILVVLIAIAALYAMGVFSGSGATSCILDAPFGCDVVISSAAGGDNFAITAQGVTSATYVITFSNSECTVTAPPPALKLSSDTTIPLTCAGIITKGQKLKGDVTITYKIAGSTLTKAMTGTWGTTAT